MIIPSNYLPQKIDKLNLTMKNRLLIVLALCVNFSWLQAQSSLDSLLKVGDTHFESKDYETAKAAYTEIKKQSTKGSQVYNYVADQICCILYFQRDDLRAAKQYEASIKFQESLLRYIETEKEYIRPFWQLDQKCVIIMGVIINYFTLEDYANANRYKAKLYKMYREGTLPDSGDFKKYFYFDMFEWNGLSVSGREYYQKLGDPDNKAGFSKVIYDVYSIDAKGNDKDHLYQLQVLKVHKRDASVKMDDYVLSILYPTRKPGKIGGPDHDYTYNRVIDYVKLKKDIIEVLEREEG